MKCSMKSEVKHVELQVSLFFLFLISFYHFFVFFSNNYYALSDEYT